MKREFYIVEFDYHGDLQAGYTEMQDFTKGCIIVYWEFNGMFQKVIIPANKVCYIETRPTPYFTQEKAEEIDTRKPIRDIRNRFK